MQELQQARTVNLREEDSDDDGGDDEEGHRRHTVVGRYNTVVLIGLVCY